MIFAIMTYEDIYKYKTKEVFEKKLEEIKDWHQNQAQLPLQLARWSLSHCCEELLFFLWHPSSWESVESESPELCSWWRISHELNTTYLSSKNNKKAKQKSKYSQKKEKFAVIQLKYSWNLISIFTRTQINQRKVQFKQKNKRDQISFF